MINSAFKLYLNVVIILFFSGLRQVSFLNIPKFEGAGIETVRGISDWVDSQLQPVRMNVLGLLRLGTRTPKQVLERGKFAPVLGCFDKSIIIASLLKDSGFDTSLVLQQVLQNGKPISCHFAIEAQKNGKIFAVDPHPKRTDFYETSLPSSIPGRMSSPFNGASEVVYKIVHRKKLPENHWNIRGYSLAGFRTALGVLKIAGVSKAGFARFSITRIRGQAKRGTTAKRNRKKRAMV
jgi:hypothetical protein